jgi:hypothetical protein
MLLQEVVTYCFKNYVVASNEVILQWFNRSCYLVSYCVAIKICMDAQLIMGPNKLVME